MELRGNLGFIDGRDSRGPMARLLLRLVQTISFLADAKEGDSIVAEHFQLLRSFVKMSCLLFTLGELGQVIHERLLPRCVFHSDDNTISIGQGLDQVLEVVHGNVTTVLEVIIKEQGLGGVEGDVFTRVLTGLEVLQLLTNTIKVIFGLGLQEGAQLNVKHRKGGVFPAFQFIPQGGVHERLQQKLAVRIVAFVIVIPTRQVGLDCLVGLSNRKERAVVQDTDHFLLGVPGIREACDGVHAMILDVPLKFFINLEEVGALGDLDFGGTVTFATAFQEGLDAISLGGSPQLKRGVDRGGCGGSPVDVGCLTHLDNPVAKAIPFSSTHFSRGRFWNGVWVNGAAGRWWRRAGEIGVAGRVSPG